MVSNTFLLTKLDYVFVMVFCLFVRLFVCFVKLHSHYPNYLQTRKGLHYDGYCIQWTSGLDYWTQVFSLFNQIFGQLVISMLVSCS